MVINIIEEKDINLTREEFDELRREWAASNLFNSRTMSFESFVRNKCERKKHNPHHPGDEGEEGEE